MGEVRRSTKIIMFASSDLKCEIYLIQMLNILKKMLEIRKYYTQAGNVINILSGEHQHNVNSLAFLSLFGYTLIERGEERGGSWSYIAGTESISISDIHHPLHFLGFHDTSIECSQSFCGS